MAINLGCIIQASGSSYFSSTNQSANRTGSWIHDNGGCGIYLNSCSDVAVDGCLIHDNKGSSLSSFNTTHLSYDGAKLVGDVDID